MNVLLLFKFESLPVFVYQFDLLFVFVQLLPGSPVSGLVFVYCCPHPALQVIGVCVTCYWHLLSAFSGPIVLQCIVRMFKISMSGMPNNACPFPGTIKKKHILHLLLYYTFTLYITNYVIVVWIYIFSPVFVFLVAANCSIIALGSNFLYMYNGIMFSITTFVNIIWNCYYDTV